jgi:rfaE bifunctional protein kinase chain/domain
VLGDFCLDRYLEIDPAKSEISIETNLEVYNVVNIRGQPGAAGTVVNNLAALGVGEIIPIGFRGDDAEGFELQRSLGALGAVSLSFFFSAAECHTFTYTKPLVLRGKRPPRELNRLDLKNWKPTPKSVRRRIVESLREVSTKVDALIVLDQAPLAGTGVVTAEVLTALKSLSLERPGFLMVADSRRSLRAFPDLVFKMNAAELAAYVDSARNLSQRQIREIARATAHRRGRPVVVTLAHRGILGALPSGEVYHLPALPVRGPLDIVGAGDAVTANVTTALASGATLPEALEMGDLAASIVIHQLGDTGTASVAQLRKLLR